jgi:hypothetical protein
MDSDTRVVINTTVTRNNFNRSLHGWLNLRVASPTGISPGSVLTVGGVLLMTVHQAMPAPSGACFNCQITGMPRGKGKLLIKNADTVTG